MAPVQIAIADAESDTDPTAAITVPADADRYMAAVVWVRDATTAPNSVQANGTPLSLVATIGTTSVRMFLYELVNPPSGSYNVVADMPGGSPSDSAIRVKVWKDVHQSSPRRGAPATFEGSTAASSLDVASAVGDLVCDFLWQHNSQGDQAPGAGQTQDSPFNASTTSRCESSEEAGAAGNVTMSWTRSGAISTRHAAFSLQPAAAASSVVVLRRRRDGY